MGGAAEGGHVKRRMRLCMRSKNDLSNTPVVSLGKTDAIPGFPWPPPILAEFREVFRVPKLTMVKPPEDKAR